MLYSPSGKAKREATCHRGGATRQSGPQGKVTGQVLEDTSGRKRGGLGAASTEFEYHDQCDWIWG